MGIEELFQSTLHQRKYTWGIRSYIRYTHCSASLTVAHRNLPILFADNMLIANCIYHRNELSSSDNISENTYRTVIGQTHESILAEYEEMNTGNAYTDNALYGMRKINGVNYQLTGGFCGELSSVKQENAYSAHSYSFYTVPRIEWERNDFCSLPPLLSGGLICQSNLIAVFVSPHSFVSVINLLPVGKCPY